MWRCESDLNRHLLDRQSSALPLSYRTGSGKRLFPAACQMSFTRRLLDGNSGGRLHANAPSFYTIALACEAHTTALSVVSHDSRCLYRWWHHNVFTHRASLRRYSRLVDNSGDRTCLVRSARPLLRTSTRVDDSEFGCYGWIRTNIFADHNRRLYPFKLRTHIWYT